MAARYDKNAGINGRTQGLRKDAKPDRKAIITFIEAPAEIPVILSQIKKLDAKARFAILLNWLVKTKIPNIIKIIPNI